MHQIFGTVFLAISVRSVRVKIDLDKESRELPTGGAWNHDITEELARRQLGRCIHPEDFSDADLKWVSELQVDAKNVPRPLEAWGQSYGRDLQKKIAGVSVGGMLPQHRAVGLTSARTEDVEADRDYPVSKCQSFVYDSDEPDPHGCRLFRNSFERLQGLKQCIVEKLEVSEVWRRYRAVVKAIRMAREDKTRWTDNPARLTDEDLEGVMEEWVQDCKGSGKCVILDANLRADEMIKYLGFKDWSLVTKDLMSWVNSKVRYTASVHRKDDNKVIRQLGLEHPIVDAIVSECFGVTSNTYDELPEETKILQRSLSCNPLMFDTIEVPGAPQPPLVNAAGMWDQVLGKQGKELAVGTLTNTPPVCARAALALVGHGQVHAPKGYSVLTCLGTEKRPWAKCAAPSAFNCICLEKCWRSALKRVCELAPGEADGCCGDMSKIM